MIHLRGPDECGSADGSADALPKELGSLLITHLTFGESTAKLMIELLEEFNGELRHFSQQFCSASVVQRLSSASDFGRFNGMNDRILKMSAAFGVNNDRTTIKCP